MSNSNNVDTDPEIVKIESIQEEPSKETLKNETKFAACGHNEEVTITGFERKTFWDLETTANNRKEVCTVISEIVKIESALQEEPSVSLKDKKIGSCSVKDEVVKFGSHKNVTSAYEFAENTSSKVGTMLPGVVKCELVAEESFSGSLKDESEITSVSVSSDKAVLCSGDNGRSEFEESSVLTYLAVKIKREHEDGNEIASVLEHLCDSTVYDIQKAAQNVNFENNSKMVKVENDFDDSKNDFDSGAFCVPTDSKGSFNDFNKKQSSRLNIKLWDVSVVLEDLFPNYLRALGKAHSNKGACLCIYCQGKYRHCESSQYLSQNPRSKKQRMRSRNTSIKVESKKGSKLKAYQEVRKNRSVFQCDKCSRICKDRAALNNHLLVHGKAYKCRFCSEQFALMASLHYHWEEHNIEKPFKCKQCPAKFWYESVLETHLRVHSKEKPFECKQCSATFTQEGTLKVHMSVHKAKRPFKCKQCSADFKFKSNLTVHLRVHSGEKPFKCKHCSYKCMTSTNLKNHLRVHSQEKPYQCDQCPAKFTQSGGLKLHLRVHSGEKPYACKLCPAKFSQNSELTVHSIRWHDAMTPFKCTFCPGKFVDRRGLNLHVKRHTSKGRWGCAHCSAKFTVKPHLIHHLKQCHS